MHLPKFSCPTETQDTVIEALPAFGSVEDVVCEFPLPLRERLEGTRLNEEAALLSLYDCNGHYGAALYAFA